MSIELSHFQLAANDIGSHGDNDTLPFDIDNRFIRDYGSALAEMALDFAREQAAGSREEAFGRMAKLQVFSERLLAPTGGSGFRVATRIHPFWNLYFNGLGVAIAESLEPIRSPRAHSYRYSGKGEELFHRDRNWRAFREATLMECDRENSEMVVVQTDVSSFYEHISHHRIENVLDDLFPNDRTISPQVDRLLSRFAAGRSFGLPIGGQCARVLAEAVMEMIDRQLTDARLKWHRYVDDFVLIADSHSDAYKGLAILAHALADHGLTLNKSKTVILSARHYHDYVRTQLGSNSDEAGRLAQIDLHFDPYSDSKDAEYDELKEVVGSLNVRALLDMELQKSQPDSFLVKQIGRTLQLHETPVAIQLCATLLTAQNLHAFRGSWSSIMRGVAQVRADARFAEIFPHLDLLLDRIPDHSPHLLIAEASCLHYLRTIRFGRTNARAQFVLSKYSSTASQAVKRACIDCWRLWRDRVSFTRERNQWNALQSESQRQLWVAAYSFADEGSKFQLQVRRSIPESWRLGIEVVGNRSFADLYMKWTPE